MKVMLYFIAFSVLFAVVIPQLIGTFMDQDDQITEQLREGADPTKLLNGTASGIPELQCNAEGYRYHITEQGERFVRLVDTPYIVVSINKKPVYFSVQEAANWAEPIADTDVLRESARHMAVVLEDCLGSQLTPELSSLQLRYR